jgi:adenine-specific DNA-methyltransferase
MSVQIRYMGAKHGLATTVAEVIKELPSGPCLDLFAGMCSVAGALSATGRETWCNDIQKYASIVSQALVASTEMPITNEQASLKLQRAFKRNISSLRKRFADLLEEERLALQNESYVVYKDLADSWRHAGNDAGIAREILALQVRPSLPYRLATLTYAHGYFGLRQAIELDSLRYAIDYSYKNNQLTTEQALWCLTSLLETASKVCTAPGHFAEYLEVKNASTWKHIRAQRRRDVWETFNSSLQSISPYGTPYWRSRNKIFCQDAMHLPYDLSNGNGPRIIYADPPYSEAQYSRYYHVLESLAVYDYPTVKSKGRYRGDRFTTPFSLRSSVREAFFNLVRNSARLEADLVISYPSNGLLFQVGGNLWSILCDYYERVNIIKIDHKHSTLGGRHGYMTSDVEELIFVAKKPR